MLLGTYQEVPYNDKTREICAPNEVPRSFNESVGFAPVWCFPILSMEDFFAQSVCVAPNFPQVLYIIETNDFIKLDKIKMYQDIKNGERNKNLYYYENKDISDNCAEFIIKPELLLSAKMVVYICNLLRFTEGDCSIEDVFPEIKGFNFEAQNYIRSKLAIINCSYAPRVEFIGKNKDKIKGPIEYRILNEQNKMLFQYVLLPLTYKLLIENKVELLWVNSCFYSIRNAMILNGQITEWAMTDCSVEKYLNIYNELKCCVFNNRELLSLLEEGKKFERNSLCPCGSGIKFKKCHGRYIN